LRFRHAFFPELFPDLLCLDLMCRVQARAAQGLMCLVQPRAAQGLDGHLCLSARTDDPVAVDRKTLEDRPDIIQAGKCKDEPSSEKPQCTPYLIVCLMTKIQTPLVLSIKSELDSVKSIK
jgi:hypothetical protein